MCIILFYIISCITQYYVVLSFSSPIQGIFLGQVPKEVEPQVGDACAKALMRSAPVSAPIVGEGHQSGQRDTLSHVAVVTKASGNSAISPELRLCSWTIWATTTGYGLSPGRKCIALVKEAPSSWGQLSEKGLPMSSRASLFQEAEEKGPLGLKKDSGGHGIQCPYYYMDFSKVHVKVSCNYLWILFQYYKGTIQNICNFKWIIWSHSTGDHAIIR